MGRNLVSQVPQGPDSRLPRESRGAKRLIAPKHSKSPRGRANSSVKRKSLPVFTRPSSSVSVTVQNDISVSLP